MGWTKRQLVQKAYEKIGLADYFFDLTPEQLISACETMDSMVANWGGVCVRIGYPLASSPTTTNLDEDTNVPDWAVMAIYLNLATYISSDIGKEISPSFAMRAKGAYLNMINRAMPPTPEVQFPQSLPRGAGQKYWSGYNNPFFPAPCDPRRFLSC